MKLVLQNKFGASSRVKVENRNNVGRVGLNDVVGSKRITVSNKNNVGRVVFNKISAGSTAGGGASLLSQLADVNISLQQEGDVLVYNATTNTYFIKTLPRIDGGTF